MPQLLGHPHSHVVLHLGSRQRENSCTLAMSNSWEDGAGSRSSSVEVFPVVLPPPQCFFLSVLPFVPPHPTSLNSLLSSQLLSTGSRYLVRSDDMIETVYSDRGQMLKTKERRLFMLNDVLMCATVSMR